MVGFNGGECIVFLILLYIVIARRSIRVQEIGSNCIFEEGNEHRLKRRLLIVHVFEH